MLLVIWIAMDWFLSSTLRLHSRITPTRPLTLTVGEFTFADGESDGLLVLTCTIAVRTQVARVRHRATRDVRRTTEEQALREAVHFRPRKGRRRLKLNASLWHDETSLCS